MGEMTPKDLFTRWDSSEITEEEAIGQSIRNLVTLEDRLDARNLKLENLIEEQRQEILTLKERLAQQKEMAKAQTDVIQRQDERLTAQAEQIRKLEESYKTDLKNTEDSLRILVMHKFRAASNRISSLDLLVSRMIKPNEMVEIVLTELGKMANASQTISQMARQLLDMKKDDS